MKRVSTLAIGLVATVLACSEVAGQTGDGVLIVDEEVSPDVENGTGAAGPDQVFQVTVDNETVDIPWVVTADGDVIIQGDIFIGEFAELDLTPGSPLQSLDDIGLSGLFAIGNYLWPKGIVAFEIDAGVHDQTAVEKAIDAWHRATDVQFVARVDGDQDYIAFVPAPEHCISAVGMQGGRQLVKLGPECRAGNIAHEIGHALGLAHEQMRRDRSQFVQYFPDHVIDDFHPQFNSYPKHYREAGAYCYGSLMHYGEFAFSKDPGNLRTLLPPSGKSIGQRKRIDGCDSAVVDAIYASEYAKRP